MGESMKQVVLISAHIIINKAQQIITNSNAFFEDIIPVGISRIAVLGLSASKRLSNQRLKAMAALRAAIIQEITNKKIFQVKL